MKWLYFGTIVSMLVFSGNAWAYSGQVTIETHMEYPKEDREQGWLRKRCDVIDSTCTQEYDGKMFYQPMYPLRLLRKGMRAVCVAEISLDEVGAVEKIGEIACNPDLDAFKRSILDVIERFEFHPRIVDGVPEKVGNVLLKFNYTIIL